MRGKGFSRIYQRSATRDIFRQSFEAITGAAYVTTFSDRVAFAETLHQQRQGFSSLLQHLADC